ncbi:MAG: hypothetical protein F6K23_39495 [Okeania sp. SIO2C9]|uniref:hypothetical protein n=1 Tax=Okeania sp. SIO2C9 TaxID=2607791 RepID=UPI0013C15271|nr:hypothetical protein [Okeania sp. SIO2C9]NEQ78549.1 hypothetical protein [Okeania sp. SIO2C9]
MPVVSGTKIKIDDSEIPNNSIGQYTLYGRGGGYGHMQIKNDSGAILAEHIISLGANDTFAQSTATGGFEIPRGNLTVSLSYSNRCDCSFGSAGEIYYDTSKLVTPNTEKFVGSTAYAAYDLQGDHDYDDVVLSITFTKK